MPFTPHQKLRLQQAFLYAFGTITAIVLIAFISRALYAIVTTWYSRLVS